MSTPLAADVLDGPGRTVLLLHGFLSDRLEQWPTSSGNGLVAGLLHAGRRVIRVDLPAHGGSAAPSSGTIDEILDSIVAALESNATVGPLDVVGYSLGSRIAWDLAADSRVDVTRLVLGALPEFDVFEQIDVGALRAAVAGEQADPEAAGFAALLNESGRAADLLQLITGLQTTPFRPQQMTEDRPTLFLAGFDDELLTGGGALVQLVPSGRLLRVPGDHEAAIQSAAFGALALEHLTRH